MKILTKIFTTLFLAFCSLVVNAQITSEPSQDFMRSNGKIFVVMAVVLVILITLFIYLVTIDKKITRLENQSK
ncbi:MAG: CcmD family protein [Chitinophagaceae bacterium]